MKKISTGQLSNLATYREIALVISGFDAESPAVAFIDRIISESSNGANEEVVADESQMIYMLFHLNQRK